MLVPLGALHSSRQVLYLHHFTEEEIEAQEVMCSAEVTWW